MSNNEEVRHAAVKALHDIMQAVPCNSLYSLAEAVLDAGYAAPVVERQPVAEVQHGPFDDVGQPQWVRVVTLGDFDLENFPDGTKFFTSPPAPVAVVLPERREPTPENPYLTDADHEWNACIDKVKELNQ